MVCTTMEIENLERLTPRQKSVFARLSDRPKTVREIRKGLTVSESNTYVALKTLLKMGLAEKLVINDRNAVVRRITGRKQMMVYRRKT